MTLDPLVLLIDILAVYRLTRLIVKDSLLQEVRWWILNRWPSAMTEFPDGIVRAGGFDETGNVTNPHLESGVRVFKSNKTDEDGDPIWLPLKTYKLTELIECVYCASVWIAFAVMAFNPWHGWLIYFGTSLAVAGVVALIFSRLDSE